MLSELSFLIDLLLNHDLPKETKDAIAARIRDVESMLIKAPVAQDQYIRVQKQASTVPGPISLPPEQVAHTPQAQAAVAHREAILQGTRPEMITTGAGTKGPKKW